MITRNFIAATYILSLTILTQTGCDKKVPAQPAASGTILKASRYNALVARYSGRLFKRSIGIHHSTALAEISERNKP